MGICTPCVDSSRLCCDNHVLITCCNETNWIITQNTFNTFWLVHNFLSRSNPQLPAPVLTKCEYLTVVGDQQTMPRTSSDLSDTDCLRDPKQQWCSLPDIWALSHCTKGR